MVIDIDPDKRSDQAECVILHHDIIHNPGTVFHFELQWIGTTARFIEDAIRSWQKVIEKYGLRLVETYVTQISDIRERNAFQSCFPLQLAVPPPIVPDLHTRLNLPAGTNQTAKYFEYKLLEKFGFIVDVEAAELYPDHVDVVYSYRRSAFTYSQFVHRSGVAFVQVLGGSRGLMFLTNRLIGPGRMHQQGPGFGGVAGGDYGGESRGGGGGGDRSGSGSRERINVVHNKYGVRPTVAAGEIRQELEKFCGDKKALEKFYDEEVEKLMKITQTQSPRVDIHGTGGGPGQSVVNVGRNGSISSNGGTPVMFALNLQLRRNDREVVANDPETEEPPPLSI
jgi:DEP domain-containing protein 5